MQIIVPVIKLAFFLLQILIQHFLFMNVLMMNLNLFIKKEVYKGYVYKEVVAR